MENKRVGNAKFTCYFCNKVIENETETGHTSMCSQVLVPCPYKCGSYIPRINMTKHQNECVNRVSVVSTVPRQNIMMAPNNSSSLDRNVRTQSQAFQDQITKLSKRLAECERRYSENFQNSNSTQTIEKLSKGQIQQVLEIEKIKYQMLILAEWKKHTQLHVQNLDLDIRSSQKSLKEFEMHLTKLQDRIMLFERLQIDLNFLRDTLYKEQNSNRQINLEISQNVDALKDRMTQENASIGALWNDHSAILETLKKELAEIKLFLDEHKTKFSNFVFDLRAVSQIAAEAAENIEIQLREFSDLKKEVNQLKLDLEILEELSTSDTNGVFGSIMWRIKEMESRMKRSKENDIVLKSPVFYTHQYGYKIRVLLYLNGLKKWKDRYALLCIHVLKGDYDMLLKWPCNIEGTITLKDLENPEIPKDVSKYVTARRKYEEEETEEPQESSSTYIFIPHTVLLKEQYLQKDTIFLEVKIKNPNNKLETNL